MTERQEWGRHLSTPWSRAEWLEWRRKGLGGSDIGAIFGVSKWAGPWDVWLSKSYEDDGTGDDRSRMTGRLLEEAIGKWAALELSDRTGMAVELKEAPPVVHETEPWMRASPDYWLEFDDAWDGLECKAAEWPDEARGWGEELSDDIPPDYEAQVRWYMAVTECPRWWVAVFFRRVDVWRLYRIERDVELEAEMVETARRWWGRHVIGGEPPELDGSSGARRGLSHVYPQPSDRGDLRVATEEEERLVRDYQATKNALKTLDDERKNLGNQIRDAIGDRAGLRFTGGRVKWSRGKASTLHVTIRHDTRRNR